MSASADRAKALESAKIAHRETENDAISRDYS